MSLPGHFLKSRRLCKKFAFFAWIKTIQNCLSNKMLIKQVISKDKKFWGNKKEFFINNFSYVFLPLNVFENYTKAHIFYTHEILKTLLIKTTVTLLQ
jgi:hypothetical protein